MSDYFLAIDGGSQSTKISVIDDVGRVHASSRTPLQAYDLGPGGRAVHPGDDLWETLVDTCRSVLASFDGGAAALTAVGLCSIRSCRALMDEAGRLTEPVLSWMDDRVSQPLAEPGPQVHTVASAGGYLALRLTGERRDSAASYEGMWPLDPRTRQWSSSPYELARTGMPRRLLPDLVDPGALLGTITSAAAAATGLPVGCPVFATANDKAVEALGAGLRGQDMTLLSLGTYVAAMTIGEDRTTPHHDYWVNAAALPGRFLYESAGIRRGMWTLTWLRQLVSAGAHGTVDEESLQDRLSEGAEQVPAGCGGLMVIPEWLPPEHARHRRGIILGLQASHDATHLYRAVMEGIAMTMAGHTEAMEAALGTTPDRLLVSGGGARSDLMMQILADVFARPAQRAGVPDAVAVGAAICAAVGSGVHGGFEAAMAAMTRPGPVFEPVGESRDRYAELRRTFAGLPEFTDPMFRKMAGLADSAPTADPSPPTP